MEGRLITNLGSVWITANAGSGKTTYLTKRVVTLLVRGVPPERICCITYTKAAASEMRHRILKQLRALLLADDAACGQILETLLGHTPSPEETTRARNLFANVLDSETGGLMLTTIHGFCQAILRRFPLEAGINPHFTVLEETAGDELIHLGKSRLLSQYQGDHPDLNAALSLIALRTKESRFEDYINAIISARGTWETIWRAESADSLKAKLYAHHGLKIGLTEEQLNHEFTNAIDESVANLIRAELPMLLTGSTKTQTHMAAALERWIAAPNAEARLPQIETFCEVFVTQKYTIRDHLLGKKDYPENAPLRSIIGRIAEQALQYQLRLAALRSAEESFALAILARELLQLYRQAKESYHALDYDDLVTKTRELFASPAMLGWVMSKLDHRIDHLLIDEAQDTSTDQWAISRLLVEELIAINGASDASGLPRTVLVVGDEKQSIYSFNGARPELFAAQQHAFQTLLEGSGSSLKRDALEHSYRSSAAVLQLVDALATLPEMGTALSAGGTIVPHKLIRNSAAGSVTLYPLVEGEETASHPALTMPLEYTISQTAPQQLAQQVAETIESWLTEGRLLENTGKPIRPGDILILVSKRSSFVLPLIRALQRRAVPVAGIDRVTLSAHLAVKDLLALMRWVLNPADDLALAQVLRSPLIGITDETLRNHCVGRPGTLWQRLEAEEYPLLTSALAHKNDTPYDFLTHIIETLGTRIACATRFGEEVHEVLDELKSQMANMPADMPKTLAHSYDWLNGSTRQIKREQESGEADEVRIMTVHGAKGLEAPVVMLVDTTRVPTTQKEITYFMSGEGGKPLPALAISEEAKYAPEFLRAKQTKQEALLAEYNRLLYVALTRARDELHIWGASSTKVNPKSWYALVKHTLQTLGAAEEEGKRVWRCARTGSPEEVRTAHNITPPPMPAWAQRAPSVAPARETMLSPSRLAESKTVSAYATSGGGERTRGVRIHRLLELITHETTEAHIARLAAITAPEWEEGERTTIARDLASLVTREAWIWQNPSLAEVNIAGTITMNGIPTPIGGQIDRLVELPDALVLIDYKTGNHVPATQHDVPETYLLQMKAYQALLQQIHPGKTIRCALVWTAAPALMWCDEAVSTTHWPQRAAS